MVGMINAIVLSVVFFNCFIGVLIMANYVDVSALPHSVKEAVTELINSDSHAFVTEYDAINSYLMYNGIIGYTTQILTAITAIKGAIHD